MMLSVRKYTERSALGAAAVKQIIPTLVLEIQRNNKYEYSLNGVDIVAAHYTKTPCQLRISYPYIIGDVHVSLTRSYLYILINTGPSMIRCRCRRRQEARCFV
jgi:hypothetical protein